MGIKIKLFLIVSIVSLGVMVWRGSQSQKKIVFCDVAQGDGVIVIDNNFQMLVDTGKDNGRMAECLSDHLPFWDKTIEVVVISHWDSDHAGALTQLQQLYRIESIFSGTEPGDAFEQLNYSGNLKSGDVIRVGELQFEVKWPLAKADANINNENEKSLVGLLQYGIYEVLFTGDITADEERYMVWKDLLRSQISDVRYQTRRILKVSHHGSGTATSEELLNEFKPEMAVVSVGRNSFGHPKAEVMERLRKYVTDVRRTDEVGTVVIGIE